MHRLYALFVGVLATVGVTVRGLEVAPVAPMSKHWPREATAQATLLVGVLLAAALLVGVLLANGAMVLADASAIRYR
jgi:hypothetical protein